MSETESIRRKAANTFKEAQNLYDKTQYNGAANRAYYALYQAIVARFDELGIDQSELTSKVSADEAGKWLHEVVRNNSTMAGVPRTDRGVIGAAWNLRRKADYRPDDVTKEELEPVIVRIPGILKSVGA